MLIPLEIPIPTESIDRVQNKFFLKQLSLTDRKAYNYYKEHRRSVAKAINQYNYFFKAVEGLFHVIQQMIAESEGGVYIEGLGYFACSERKYRKKRRKSGSLTLKRKKMYVLRFFPDEDFEGWTIKKTVERRFKLILAEADTEHKIHLEICHSMSEAQKEARRNQRR